MDDIATWLALRDAPGLARHHANLLLERYGTPAAVFARPFDELRARCPPEPARAIAAGPDLDRARAALVTARRLGLDVVPRDAARFPELLCAIPDPPLVMWTRGRTGFDPAVAIVGSRKATARGVATARSIAAELARAGVGVVSGLAYGIDAAAHEGALAGGGCTAAILASGLDRPSPAGNRDLARRILAGGGGWLSEHPPGTAAYAAHFPERNRLISGLARVVLVVEARDRSGTLWTARHALDQDRPVLVVPGPVDSAACAGSNRWLRDGAGVALGADDLLTVLELAGFAVRPAAPSRPAHVRGVASSLLALLEDGPRDPDALARALDLAPAELAGLLLELELDGRILRHGSRVSLER